MKKIRYVEINSIVVSMAIQFFDDVKVDADYSENNVTFYCVDGTFGYYPTFSQMVMDIKNGLLYFCVRCFLTQRRRDGEERRVI